MLRGIMIALGAALVGDTLLVSTVSNMNLGVVLPALIGLPLLIGVFHAQAKRFFMTKWGKWVRGALICGYALFLASFAAVTVRIATESASEPAPGADAVIVLGAAVRGDVPSATLAARLDCARAYLMDNPDTRVIVTGGRGQGESVTEAAAMQRYLTQRGIEQERVVMEDKSTSTLENLRNAKAILAAEFPENPRVIVVSSDYHLYRAKLVAKKLGMEVETMGNPSIPWLVPNFYLREYVAVMGYRLLGRMG